MLYTDLFFVFAFLPITVLVSFFDRSAEYKNLILVISSVIFFTWGRPIIILLLFTTVIADYLFGLGAACKKRYVGLLCLIFSIAMNAAFFLVFARNYLFDNGEVLDKFSQLSFADKLIPLGIVFYTIRGAGYVVDVFKKNTDAEKNPFCLLTYMVSYHFMFVSPVIRYNDIKKELRERTAGFKELNDGLTRFVYGLGKAVVVAPVFKKLFETGLVYENMTTMGVVFGMVGFIMYYFWAFWGYNDMAIGLGLMNGFHYKDYMSGLDFTKGFTNTVKSINGGVVEISSELIVYRGKSRILYVLTGVVCGAFVGAWYGFYKGALSGALFIALFVISENLFLNRVYSKIPKFAVGFFTLLITLSGVGMFAFDAFWKGKKWVMAFLGKADAFKSAEITEILKNNYIIIAIGVIFAFPFARNILKKIAEVLSRHKAYGLVRITQTVFVAAVFAMYTIISYHGVK